ncbi:hypothetical protein NQZ68_003226 [Dissostichus eleginoides]|nr:hypothetical protein NQZ68_003226 [Dissostichus eleginoides]
MARNKLLKDKHELEEEEEQIRSKLQMEEEGIRNKLQMEMERVRRRKEQLQMEEDIAAHMAKLDVKAPATNKEMENKMKWTSVLYKAEGLKIKDDEDMLRSSLKKEWGDQSENIVEKMQKRQEEMGEHPTSLTSFPQY